MASPGRRGRQLPSISVEGNHLERKRRKLLGRQLRVHLCGRVFLDGHHQLGQDRLATAVPCGASRAPYPDRVDMAPRSCKLHGLFKSPEGTNGSSPANMMRSQLLALGGEHEHQAYTRRPDHWWIDRGYHTFKSILGSIE